MNRKQSLSASNWYQTWGSAIALVVLMFGVGIPVGLAIVYAGGYLNIEANLFSLTAMALAHLLLIVYVLSSFRRSSRE